MHLLKCRLEGVSTRYRYDKFVKINFLNSSSLKIRGNDGNFESSMEIVLWTVFVDKISSDF